MKTRLLFSTFLASALILTGCANKDSNQDDKQHHTTASQVPKHVKKITESDIFTSNKKNADISEKEMKEALTKYLAVNNDILDNKYYMQHELDKQSDSQTKVTDKQADRLSELSNLTVKNDLHFKNFVADNHIPKSYDKNTQRIINYFKALNSAISNVDETIEKLSYQPQNSINIVDVPTNYAGDVNKSQQDKIKDFLKSKNIPTDAINK
ncbi:NDxxF motif lipoprotein [Staphylococcus simiae]|uniref:NDxxF motif lipoprotein n=1 Tax=Staphylococcus simiae CCM 7213 = CCUG 51256 TaxID=911238 RepID=G5JL34_9STAP|nr:NDxxF motif lipoprotein [Staphylococcus simiae]EHJ07121.1 hypothetical protein SS7213T_10989 [Staphylococcus simiae CCM 7213 = CCUG 51256]PNZ09404.1 NDxxF motif lipoprotein [Staphylococcus simiae]SNV60453.1 lipoprotein [Staphylococcus simiae]